MSIEIVGVFLEQILGGDCGIFDLAGLEVQLGQPVVEELRSRVGVQRQLVLFDGAGGILAAPVVRRHLFIVVGEGIVIVGRRTVGSRSARGARRRGSLYGFRLPSRE